MRDVYVAGAGMTQFGKFPNRPLRSLAEAATSEALVDAGVRPGDVGMIFFANATAGILTGQEMIRGQAALRNTGLLGLPIVNVENACASASTAFYLAWMAVAGGAADIALAVGAEKLTHPDKRRTFAAIGTALDLERVEELRQAMARTPLRLPAASLDAGSPLPVEAEAVSGSEKHSLFMEIYAGLTLAYMEQSGASPADFARVAVKSHRHGALNPKAQYRQEVTVEEVLASREVAQPLTLLMCSPIGDGAASVLLCSSEVARRLGAEVRVASTVLVSGQDRGADGVPAAERAARRAYELAGIGPEDVDLAEVHDAAAPAELMIYEELGFCRPGDGPELLASGDTALGGRMPVNPSGGLLSKGHPIGATGCAQLVELVDQLRGRCGPRQVDRAQVALAENGGGFLGNDPAAVVVTVLAR